MDEVRDKRVVLDASALVAWLRREPGWDVVDRALERGVVASPCMTEVLYSAVAAGYSAPIAEFFQGLLLRGVVVEPMTEADCVRSAELVVQSRGRSRLDRGPGLSLANSICIAVAERLGFAVVSGDRHWMEYELSVPFLPFR